MGGTHVGFYGIYLGEEELHNISSMQLSVLFGLRKSFLKLMDKLDQQPESK